MGYWQASQFSEEGDGIMTGYGNQCATCLPNLGDLYTSWTNCMRHTHLIIRNQLWVGIMLHLDNLDCPVVFLLNLIHQRSYQLARPTPGGLSMVT
jgi:hypothetical protein